MVQIVRLLKREKNDRNAILVSFFRCICECVFVANRISKTMSFFTIQIALELGMIILMRVTLLVSCARGFWHFECVRQQANSQAKLMVANNHRKHHFLFVSYFKLYFSCLLNKFECYTPNATKSQPTTACKTKLNFGFNCKLGAIFIRYVRMQKGKENSAFCSYI